MKNSEDASLKDNVYSGHISKLHHQWTDNNQDYACFQVKCAECGMLLFEFVHHQEYSFSQDRIMAIPDPSPSMGAQSWYKPAVKVAHYDTAYGVTHEFEPVREGEDRNQVVTSEPWTREQFEEWSKQ